MSARMKVGGALAAVGFVASILLANWLTTKFGFVSVGFGFTATAGTFAAGFALALRDATQDTLGRWPVVAVIVTGAALSFAVADPFIAVASATAFLVSEMTDFAIYTPLRKRTWAGAVIASNTVGAIIDTAIFIGIAFGLSAISGAMLGQLVGKSWATIAYLIVGTVARALLRKPKHTQGA